MPATRSKGPGPVREWLTFWGVMLGGNTDALVERCEIAYNRVDGFRDTYGGRRTTVRECYIHHHWDSHAHPDNIQTVLDRTIRQANCWSPFNQK